jgi:methylmalonyl-CoA mutase
MEGNPNVEKNDILGGLNYDPLMLFCTTGNLDEKDISALSECIRLSSKMADFRALTIHGDHFHNAGANTAQEIALVTSAATEYIEAFSDQGNALDDILSSFGFSLAVGTNYFMEIAKIRALRTLFYHVLQMYNVSGFHPGNIYVHSESSIWTKTIYDPYVNMLRNTTEAMSALLGGCNSLSISAFDEIFQLPGDFSKRISRNISNLLKEESYFDRVSDPAAGSYYIETLTDKLVERSLEIFKDIESNGGFIQSFEKGMIRAMIDQTRDKKHDNISKRREVIIGTNQYPNITESIDTDDLQIQLDDADDNLSFIRTSRGAIPFEQLRSATDRFVKRNGEDSRPTVFLSLIGDNKIMRKARATFASGFFGCAGFKVVESSPSPDLFKAVHKAIDSKGDIVVICGSDEDYITHGVDYAKAFKGNCDGILVVAGNPEEKREALLKAGVDDFINIRTNLIDSLYNFQDQLNISND